MTDTQPEPTAREIADLTAHAHNQAAGAALGDGEAHTLDQPGGAW